MKKNLSSWIFVAIVLLIGGYSFYEYQYGKADDVNEKNTVALFSLYAPDVSLVKIQKPDQEPLILTKKNDQWMVTGPFEDLADLQLGVSYVVGLVGEKGKLTKKEQGEIQWQDYQLDQPAYIVEVEDAKGQKESIAISGTQTFDGNYFIRKGSDLIVGTAAWQTILSRDFNYFRDKKIFRDPFNIIRVDGPKFTLEKQDSGWKILGKNMKNYDSQKIEKLIEAIKDLRANQFVSDGKLGVLGGRLTASGPEGKTWWVELGPVEKGLVYAKSSAIEGVFQLTADLAEPLRVSLDSFRNGRLPFQFDVEHVHRIRISTVQNKIDLKKSDLKWVLSKNDDKKEVNQEALTQFFQKLQNLNAQKFLNDAPAAVKYFNSIQLIDAEDKEILRIRWGDNAFVSSSKGPETLVMNLADLTALPIAALVKDKLDHKAEEHKTPTETEKGGTDGEVTNKN